MSKICAVAMLALLMMYVVSPGGVNAGHQQHCAKLSVRLSQ